jgi:acyl-CoA synthetase (AMP-forming)/AMP-acid ligase II
MDTLLSYLRHHRDAHPDRLFCRFIQESRETEIRYQDLLMAGDRYARHFRSLGVGAGDSVIIVLQHTPHLLYAFAGALLNILGTWPRLLSRTLRRNRLHFCSTPPAPRG